MARSMIHAVILTAPLAFAACGDDGAPAAADAAPPGWSDGPALPEPIANNAVAALPQDGGCARYTAFGLDASRAQAGIHARAFRLAPGADAWEALPDVPGPGRLAASAVALRGRLYVLGGYLVAPGGGEQSTTDVFVFDPATGAWSSAAPLPVAIDDAVVVAWRDRWIVVVSGWSDTAPVGDVQLYDVEADAWTAATPFPGRAVFGHAGGLVDDTLVVIDGVASGFRGFSLVGQAWRAELDPAAPATIAWTDLGGHPGPARYRAAAGGLAGAIVFAGGTDAPYNFDGLTYDGGAPAPPLDAAFAYDVAAGGFVERAPAPRATMDHRALVGCGDSLAAIGGMVEGPEVTDAVQILHP